MGVRVQQHVERCCGRRSFDRRVKTIPAGTRPEGSALNRDGRMLFGANREGAKITMIAVYIAGRAARLRFGAGHGQ